MKKVLSYVESNKKNFLDGLKELLKIESISADPEKKKDCLKAAQFEIDHLKKIGMKNVTKIETAGLPLLYADWLHAPGKPTILLYGHYDVQPPDPIDLWKTPPFEPVVKDNFIIARGADDNKGQHWPYFCAIESYLKTTGTLPINVKIIIEGEEESGSHNTEKAVRENAARLKCDAVLLSDNPWHDREHPAICLSLRGLCYFQIDLTGPSHDLHSGLYGGMVQNPLNALTQIIAELKDSEGHILIPGFYDDVLPITEKDRENLKKLPFNEIEFSKEVGTKAIGAEKGFDLLEGNWFRPTLDVNGIWGGYQGKGGKTIIPSKASAKVSCRLVANQNPMKIHKLFADCVHSLVPAGMQCEIQNFESAPAVAFDADHPFIQKTAVAFGEGLGKEVIFIRGGASIPIVATFKDVLKVPVVMMGLGLPEDRIHSPNECFSLDNFYGGIKGVIYTFSQLAERDNGNPKLKAQNPK